MRKRANLGENLADEHLAIELSAGLSEALRRRLELLSSDATVAIGIERVINHYEHGVRTSSIKGEKKRSRGTSKLLVEIAVHQDNDGKNVFFE